MAQNFYEGLYILDSNKFARDPDGVVRQITDVLTEYGAEILVSRIWEERRLAYPIKKQRRGTYWLIYFKCESTKMEEIRRRLQLAPDILRFMHIKIDPRIIDVLVEHARGGQVAVRTVSEADLGVDEEIDDEADVEEMEDADVVDE
ncbi:SSU ribosomal protein S6p [Thermogutta terrifontis]|uniref:Small ribosomal subunit protein bS6 n=1 Tax=Thermogutta terrifontis TaxID=1331910 RepID=A0A286RL15_9BACT|nr:30S ribosomal protein S6 [Thermogutta terrifontis]ASV76617.1 SSU ribosomal protein S6p [Thermogutta terrifontis]